MSRPAPHAAPTMRQRSFTRPTPAAPSAQRPALRQGPAAQPPVARQQQRLQQQQNRAERRLQQQENRTLRALPPAQRAQRLQDIRQQRALRAQQRQNGAAGIANGNSARPNARPNNAARISNPAIRQGLANGRFAQGRFAQGRFAQGRFAQRQALLGQNANGARLARANARAQAQAANRFAVPRHSWHRGRRAAFVAWIGAVYWPYAYSDLFDYTFFPYAYEDDYWGVAYDDMFDGVFWADGGPYAGASAYAAAPSGSGRAPTAQMRSAVQSANQACRTPGQGVTAWPFAQIRRAVKLTDNQQDLLRDLESAAKRAADAFKAACPTDAPLTPPGRLDAVIARLQANFDAVEIVRPPLDAFYGSLSDEQKARFNLIGPTLGQSTDDKTARQETLDASGKVCKEQKPGLVDLPVDSIEATVKPTDAQRPALEKLQQATRDAVDKLNAACPDAIAQTPPGRLEQASARLKAMIDAANTVKPALDDFFAGLSDEQKSLFNTMQAASLDDTDAGNN